MQELVEKLTGRKQASESHEVLPDILFGSFANIGNLFDGANRPRLRVGIWPVQSQTMPETAMGIATILGLLLERWPAIRVYRLFAHLDGEAASYQWDMQHSQFSVDDWELEGLDENVAIWGNLGQSNGTIRLTLEIENDVVEDDVKVISTSASNLGDLVANLVPIAEEIADYLDAGDVSSTAPAYEINQPDESALQGLLNKAFQWELHLLLSLWGKTWNREDIEQSLDSLVGAGGTVKHDFGAWVVARLVARALLPLFAPIDSVLLPKLSQVAEPFEDDPTAALALGMAAYAAGDSIQAYDLLEASVELHPDSVTNWLGLAQIFQQANELSSTIDALQRAIENDAVSVALYMRYAELMNFLHSNNLTLALGSERTSASGLSYQDRLILLDSDDERENLLVHEAAAAYQEALEIDPNNIEALYQYSNYLVNEHDEDRLWPEFTKLVKSDQDGEHTRSVVDAFFGIDDISRGIKILQTAISDEPDRTSLRISLGAALLIDEDSDAARVELEAARSMVTDDSPLIPEIDRLLLAADDPDFEARIGEITDLVNAGNEISAEDVEFLEETLDRTPSFSEGYILLASAYLAWEEADDAMDVLLEGQKHAPHDPEITMMLARVLWDAEAEDLAFEYLNKGLQYNPTHVGMLALTGQYLFEDGQDAAAKEFLARAEALNPVDPVLRAARSYIARALSDMESE